MELRRKDLTVTDPTQIDEIILSCDCIRLAFADGIHPYIVPLSFGYRREAGTPVFYYHGAAEGRKITLSRTLGYAGFELDTNVQTNSDDQACDFSVRYQSVVGEGAVTELIEPQEKAEALQILMAHYSAKDHWDFPETALAKTAVFKLTAAILTAKAHK